MKFDAIADRKSKTGRLFGAGLLVAIGGLLGTSTTAWCYGVGADVAVYFGVWGVCGSLLKLFQAGQIGEISIPRYISERHADGRRNALDNFSVLVNWITLLSVSVASAVSLWSRELAKLLLPGFAGRDAELAGSLLGGLAPILPVLVYGGFLQSLGNAEGLYGKFELWLFAGQMAGTATIFALNSHLGIWALVLAAWVSQVIGTIGRFLHLHHVGCGPSLRLLCPKFSVRSLFGDLGLTSTYVLVTQCYLLLFNAALSYISPIGISTFRYAETIFERSSSLVFRPVGTIFFTEVSSDFAQGGAKAGLALSRALRDLKDYWGLYFCLAGSCAGSLVALVWGGGGFDRRSTDLAAMLFAILSGASLFRAISLALRKFTIAAGFAGRQYAGYIVVQCIMAIITLPVVKSFGLSGAVAVPIGNMIGFLASDLIVARSIGIKPIDQSMLREYGVSVLACGGTILISFLIVSAIEKLIGEAVANRKVTDLFEALVAIAVVLFIMDYGWRRIGLKGLKQILT